MKRRNFLKAIIGLSLSYTVGIFAWKEFKPFRKTYRKIFRQIPGELKGPSMELGHKIRDKINSTHIPSSTETIETEVLIVGGGIAGLSAAWWLKKHGFNDFLLLEMEKEIGGNSSSDKNNISAYPWGAHYVPLPGNDAHYVKSLFEELGIIEGYDTHGLPIYNEYYLCHDPEDRLFKDGKWHDGLIPQKGLNQKDQAELERFFKIIGEYKLAIGNDGKSAFTIPLALSSNDSKFRKLDQISMAEWMKEQNFQSQSLNWYINYCCRDDYGGLSSDVSAWAGIHYFASRKGIAANAEKNTVLTWPEGNAWLANRLREKCSENIKVNSIAYSIHQSKLGIETNCLNSISGKSFTIKSKQLIYAAPRFTAKHIIEELKDNTPEYFDNLEYSPWMVANISLSQKPTGRGAPLSWDNVSYYSQSLGYIVATHQSLSAFSSKTVITYYLPLTEKSSKEARIEAQSKNYPEWVDLIIADLELMHEGIEEYIERIDVWVWGHGMIKPKVNVVWGKQKKEMQKSIANIHFAHSDMSGISIFEEAQYHGVEAAIKVLNLFDKNVK